MKMLLRFHAMFIFCFTLHSSHALPGSLGESKKESLSTYESTDYFYDEGHEVEEEPMPTLHPTILSESLNVVVAKGEEIRLPCLVDELGPTIITWNKLNFSEENGQTGNIQTLILGDKQVSHDTRIRHENNHGRGSTLIITNANEEDSGEYACEVSSIPPATLKHKVSLSAHPRVKIVKPNTDVYTIHAGQELALVCHGLGDIKLDISWKKEKKRLPDGRHSINGSQIIFQNVTRKHSGTYICEATAKSGKVVQDSIKVDVLYPPEISSEQSTIQQNDVIITEFSCTVHGYPMPNVRWLKDGLILDPKLMTKYEMSHIGKKHLLTVSGITAEDDAGNYTCRAVNELGEVENNFHIMHGVMADESKTIRSSMKKELIASAGISNASSTTQWISLQVSIVCILQQLLTSKV